MRTRASLLAVGLALGSVCWASAETAAADPPIAVALVVQDAAGATPTLPEGSSVTAGLGDDAVERIELDRDRMQVLLPHSGRWRLCLRAEGLWADCQTAEVPSLPAGSGEATAQVELTVWPAALLRGRVRTAESDEVPGGLSEALRVFVGPPPGMRPPRGFRDSRLECSVAADGSFSCAAPATPLYVAVRLSGFVSRYFWGLSPAPDAPVDLGTLRFERGASLAGELDLGVEGLETEKVTVRLHPAVGRETGVAVSGSLAKDRHEARVTPLGFFQFGGVRPGSYMLEVKHPSFATTELGPFEIYDGKETRLRDPVRLMPPVDIAVQIQPALSPFGRPWRVDVFRERDWSAGSDRVFVGDADPTGAVALAGQTPGLFEIHVADDQGNRFYSNGVRIESGDTGFVPIEVPIVRVRGEIRLGSDPLRATLRFGGEHGALRSRVASDDEGTFEGVLAREGEWTVEIESTEPDLSTVRRVEVEAGEDGEAELEIELDDTELVGRVVSADGQPIPEARVRVSSQSELVTKRTTSDEAGEFRIRALPVGPAMLSASAVLGGRQTTSAPLAISLQDEQTTGPVELVLQPLHSFTGRVISATGPTPGAQIFATSLDLPVPAVGSAVSDLDGSFELELPVPAGLVALVLLPPGGFLSTTIQRLESPLELRPAAAGGTLRIRVPEETGSDFVITVEREGVSIGLPLLARWSRGHGVQMAPPRPGDTLSFPRLAEGAYRVCAIDEALRRRSLREGASWQQIEAAANRCATGSLMSGGTLELSLASD